MGRYSRLSTSWVSSKTLFHQIQGAKQKGKLEVMVGVDTYLSKQTLEPQSQACQVPTKALSISSLEARNFHDFITLRKPNREPSFYASTPAQLCVRNIRVKDNGKRKGVRNENLTMIVETKEIARRQHAALYTRDCSQAYVSKRPPPPCSAFGSPPCTFLLVRIETRNALLGACKSASKPDGCDLCIQK